MSSYTYQKFHFGVEGSGGQTSDWWAVATLPCPLTFWLFVLRVLEVADRLQNAMYLPLRDDVASCDWGVYYRHSGQPVLLCYWYLCVSESNWSATVVSKGRNSCERCFVMTQMSTLEPEPRSPCTPASTASRTSCIASSRCVHAHQHHRHCRRWQTSPPTSHNSSLLYACCRYRWAKFGWNLGCYAYCHVYHRLSENTRRAIGPFCENMNYRNSDWLWCRPQNRKYITYRNTAREGATNSWRSSVVWFRVMLADRQTISSVGGGGGRGSA